MKLSDMRCPVCDCILETNSTLYVRDGECIGCECCVSIDFPDEEEEDNEEERYADYCDFLNDLAREEKLFGI